MTINSGLSRYRRMHCDACTRAEDPGAHGRPVTTPCPDHCTACGADATGQDFELRTLTISEWDPATGAEYVAGSYCPQCGRAIKALLEIGA